MSDKNTEQTPGTREAVRAYVRQVLTRQAAGERTVERWLALKRVVLVVLLAFAASQHYVLDVLLEIAMLPSMTFFVLVNTISGL